MASDFNIEVGNSTATRFGASEGRSGRNSTSKLTMNYVVVRCAAQEIDANVYPVY